jgi:hypothetical protein
MARCTQYNIMWKSFVSDLRQVGGFLRVLRFPPHKKKTDRQDITEILLKEVLYTITLNNDNNNSQRST